MEIRIVIGKLINCMRFEEVFVVFVVMVKYFNLFFIINVFDIYIVLLKVIKIVVEKLILIVNILIR